MRGPAKVKRTVKVPPAELFAQRLAALIEENGRRRAGQQKAEEEEKALPGIVDPEDDDPLSAFVAATLTPAADFEANRVLAESNGFEIWLGSLEDALCMSGLHTKGIDGVLNCALEECETECEAGRGHCGGRSRSMTRGISLSKTPGESDNEFLIMDKDQIREAVSFNGDWYTEALGYDVLFHGYAAEDAADYPIKVHFEESGEFLRQCRFEGRKVLVHCIMGINRSAAVLVAFLCRDLGMDLEEAVEIVSKHRGHVLSNRTFLAQLVEHFGAEAETEPPPGTQAAQQGCKFCLIL